MTITTEQLVAAMQKLGMELQWFPVTRRKDEAPYPVTCGSFDLRKIVEAVNAIEEPPPSEDDLALIALARETYAVGSDDDIEVDRNATVSRGDEGAFVQAWVWVPYPDGNHDEGDEADHGDDSEGGHCD